MVRTIALAACAFAGLSSPAAAVTILFGGADATPFSLSGTVGDIDYTLTAARFALAPSLLESFSQLGAPLRLNVTAPGVGVNGGGGAQQLDTNRANRREAFIFTTNAPIRINGLRLSWVDQNDTLLFFGVKPGGDLVPLVNSGTIRSGLNGAAAVVNQNGLNNGTSTLTFPTPWGYFDRYVFTTRVGGDVVFNGGRGQGYRLDSISIDIIPEPQTWALLIAGFGLVGLSARRRIAAA